MRMATASIYDEIHSRLNEISYGGKKFPKYRQLSDAILALIKDGDIKPGERLPTETMLTEKLPFSLGTIQKAMRSLSQLGAIKRTRRRGTIVSERTSEIFDLWQFRFMNEKEERVYPIFSKVLEMRRIESRGPWSEFLGQDSSFVRIDRVIDIGHHFKIYTSFFLSFSHFGGVLELQRSDLEGVHLSAVVQRMFGSETVRTKNRIVCTTLPDAATRQLKLHSGAFGLACDILGYGSGDKPLTFQRAYVPANVSPIEFLETKPTW